MDKINETIYYNSLLSIYGCLLSETQKDIATSYFEYDLSISEIAENKKISRSAIEDAIKKSLTKLKYYESKLHILEKNTELLDLVNKIKNNEDKEKNINELERIIKDYGI